MTASDSRRKEGGQPGNKNALKHALYARHYSPEVRKKLLTWDIKDLVGEIHLLRACLDRVSEILLKDDSPVNERVAMLNSLERTSRTVAALANRHLLLNTSDDPYYIAWDDITHERHFFEDGVPPV
jgi:hypothetical protein